MPKPSRAQAGKQELIAGLIDVRRRILEVARSLPSAAQDEVFLGLWSTKDLLAHLVGWDLTNIKAAREVLQGRLPTFYAHEDRDWRTYNALLVEKHKVAGHAQLLEDVAASHRQLIEHVESIPAEELDRDRGIRFRGWKVTIARLLKAERKDEEKHWEQLREYADQVM